MGIGAKAMVHTRYVTFQMAEVAIIMRSWPDFTAGSSDIRADMSGTVLVEMEIAPDPWGLLRFARTTLTVA